MAFSTVLRIVNLHRAQLAGLAEIRGVGRLRPLYEEARADLERKLRRAVRAGRGDTFGAHHLRLVLAQVADACRAVQDDVYERLEDTGAVAARLAPRQHLAALEALQEHFKGATPVLQAREAAVFQYGFGRGAMPASLLDRFRASSRLYGPETIRRVRDQLSLSMLQGEGVDDAVDRVAGTDGVFAAQRWRAERIVRTETAHAVGVSGQRALTQLAQAVPKLQKRLVATRDDREGEDSKELDGQIVDVDQPFVWVVKNAAGVSTGKVVRYMAPPNRPNDREVVIPWRADWPASPLLDSGGEVAPTTRGLPPPA